MNYPLLGLFESNRSFIHTANRTCSVSFNYSSKVITAIEGSLELLFENSKLPGNKSVLSIGEVIPAWFYNKIDRKILQFYILKKRKTSGQYFISFAISNRLTDFIKNGTWLINIHIDSANYNADISACDVKSAGSINDKLLLISEPNNNHGSRVVFASGLYTVDNLYLINNEYDVLQLLSKGYSSEAVAELLYISKYTADDYRKELLKKFQAVNIYQLIKHAQQKGFI